LKNRVKQMRQHRKLTQEALAKKLRISRQSLISIEKGKHTPSLSLAFAIAAFFDKSIEEIFIYDGNAEH